MSITDGASFREEHLDLFQNEGVTFDRRGVVGFFEPDASPNVGSLGGAGQATEPLPQLGDLVVEPTVEIDSSRSPPSLYGWKLFAHHLSNCTEHFPGCARSPSLSPQVTEMNGLPWWASRGSAPVWGLVELPGCRARIVHSVDELQPLGGEFSGIGRWMSTAVDRAAVGDRNDLLHDLRRGQAAARELKADVTYPLPARPGGMILLG